MRILFLSIGNLKDLSARNLYPDLLRAFVNNGAEVYAVCANERRNGQKTSLSFEENINILRVKVGNITNTNIIEKGISTILIETQFKKAIKKYFSSIKFDLVIYTTPPITFANVVSFVKKRDNAKTYLLLKDIFPQNAVDIGMMTKTGIKSIIYKMFRKKEEKLYRVSDYIGCMSKANVDYVLKHNPYIPPKRVHISPNTIEVYEIKKSAEKRKEIRQKYNIPQDAKVFVYGGNLGRPQDIPFVIECLKANVGKSDRFFVICGTGTEYPKLKGYVDSELPDNVLLLNGLPKEVYEEFIRAFDVGLIFLDHRFTIPNFPSRLLSYMQNSMPVIAATDPNTDIGQVVTENGFGWWCESNSAEKFTQVVDLACMADLETMGFKGRAYLEQNYTSQKSYEIIVQGIEKL